MNNNQIKYIKSLGKSKNRNQSKSFFIEGKRLITSAILYKTKIKTIYITNDFLDKNKPLINSIIKAKIDCENITNKEFEKITFTKSPSGISALCSLPEKKPINLEHSSWLYLDEISDPGNMGTILRSASYFNFNKIVLSKNCVDPFNPKVIRAGMGSHFAIALYIDIHLKEFKATHTLIGADQRGRSYKDIKYPKNYVIIIGNEAHGLTAKTLEILDEKISIKKTGFGESLNAASASSIILNYLSEI